MPSRFEIVLLLIGYLGIFGFPTFIYVTKKTINTPPTKLELFGCFIIIVQFIALPVTFVRIISAKTPTEIAVVVITGIIGIGLSVLLLKIHHSTAEYMIYYLTLKLKKIENNISSMRGLTKTDTQREKIKILKNTMDSIERQMVNTLLQDSIKICKKVELSPRNGINIQKELDELESLQKLSKIEGEK